MYAIIMSKKRVGYNMMKKFFAFTLGEILIALGVIGVVASLTLPMLINGKKASEAHAQFTTAYADISKAISEMETDNRPVDPINYSAERSFYPVFKEYFKTTVDKEYSTEGKPYRYLDGTDLSEESMAYMDDGHFVINNGMDIFIENPENNPNGLLVFVDINGNDKLPNRMGFDVFGFELVKDRNFLPLGAPGTNEEWSEDPASQCNIPDDDAPSGTGYTCSFYALSNSDYFRNVYKGH